MKYSEIITESGLSRVYRATQAHDFGTITAYRYAPECGTGTPYTYAQNQKRNASLLAKLRALGYGVTSIKGSYIENYGSPDAREVGENSFLVIDLQDRGTLRDDLLALGEELSSMVLLVLTALLSAPITAREAILDTITKQFRVEQSLARVVNL